MIIGMIKGHPTEHRCQGKEGVSDSWMIKAHPTKIGWQGKPLSVSGGLEPAAGRVQVMYSGSCAVSGRLVDRRA